MQHEGHGISGHRWSVPTERVALGGIEADCHGCAGFPLRQCESVARAAERPDQKAGQRAEGDRRCAGPDSAAPPDGAPGPRFRPAAAPRGSSVRADRRTGNAGRQSRRTSSAGIPSGLSWAASAGRRRRNRVAAVRARRHRLTARFHATRRIHATGSSYWEILRQRTNPRQKASWTPLGKLDRRPSWITLLGQVKARIVAVARGAPGLGTRGVVG